MKGIISNARVPARVGLRPSVTKVKRGLAPRQVLESSASPRPYYRGLTVPSQVGIAAALERTTPSANEQKLFTPVWFTPTGVATT